MGFAYVRRLTSEFGAYFAIQSGGHQSFFALDLSCIKNEFAIGCKTGFFIMRCLGQSGNFISSQLHQVKFIGRAASRNIGHPFAVCTQRR